jgi:hypothetical protein
MVSMWKTPFSFSENYNNAAAGEAVSCGDIKAYRRKKNNLSKNQSEPFPRTSKTGSILAQSMQGCDVPINMSQFIYRS